MQNWIYLKERLYENNITSGDIVVFTSNNLCYPVPIMSSYFGIDRYMMYSFQQILGT